MTTALRPLTATQLVRVALFLAFISSCTFHVVALFLPSISIPEPWWEHALFVPLNVALAMLALSGVAPPRAEFGIALAFSIAQLVEHTARLVMRHAEPQDWLQNVGAIAFALLLVSLGTAGLLRR